MSVRRHPISGLPARWLACWSCGVRRLRAAGIAWLGALALAAHAGLPPWPEASYSYYAENVPLERVLGDFASTFSLGLSMQPGLGGNVNGRFTAKSPSEFITRLGGVYGFSWYTHGGALHINRSTDNVMRAINLPYGNASTIRAALTQLGVLEARFGWGELPDQRVVLVSGPPSYVALVEATLRQLPGAASAQQVSVFRLRYASAEDRVVAYRDQQIRQPGLGTVLRQLLGGRMVPGGGLGTESVEVPQQAQAQGQGLGRALPAVEGLGGAAAGTPAGAGGASGPAAQAAAAPPGVRLSADSFQRVPSIQSDPRLNALIIQDVPERMPIYAALIAQLDQPTPLIEIEAMIIDVNTERAKDLGINWSLRSSRANIGFGPASGEQGPGIIGATIAAGASTIVGGGGGTTLLAQIQALERVGDARIQSRPSVLTTDNIAALLDLSETFYIRVLGERVATVSPVTAGTTLRVTPRLIEGANAAIQLTIDIEDGQIADRQIDSLPTVRRSTVSTQAIVGQDETLLIAGYTSDENISAQQKVPFFGDIPGVGLLFSNKTTVVQRRERLFMIKPKVIRITPTIAAAPPPPVTLAAPATPSAVTVSPVPVAPPLQPQPVAR